LLAQLKMRGDPVDQVLPGEIFVSNFQITIMLDEKSASAWKKAIKLTYKTVIIGSQKTTTNINMEVRNFSFNKRHNKTPREQRAWERAMLSTGTILMKLEHSH
jgi:hypothetical protein